MEDSKVLKGILINKDVTHPKMRRLLLAPCMHIVLDFYRNESPPFINGANK